MTRTARRLLVRFSCAVALSTLILANAYGQAEISPELRSKIDNLAAEALKKSGVPSASIAVVRDGKIVYMNAYGDARLEPKVAAKSEMRYSIGSISKQFT